MSWWNFPNNPILKNAIDNYDGLFVCIAGNACTNIDDNPNYPSSYKLENMIVVSAIKSDSSIPTANDWGYDQNGVPQGSNYGENTVNLFAPGDNIYSTIPTDSYLSLSGTSMAAPHVTGVAALLLSLNKNLTTVQLKNAILQSADTITITVPNDSTSTMIADYNEQNVLKLNAYNAVKYVLENYLNPTTYTLGNYSSTVNANKLITDNSSYFNELNGFYKLNVTYEKNYEFISSSTNDIEITLYDENLNQVSYDNFSQVNDKVHFIKNLNIGTYYLRAK